MNPIFWIFTIGRYVFVLAALVSAFKADYHTTIAAAALWWICAKESDDWADN
jgi:hypothetical protein